MKNRKWNLSLLQTILVIAVLPLTATAAMEDPEYSMVDGVYFSDPQVDCDAIKNSEECETFKAQEEYSYRDGIAFSDCNAECDDLYESESCFSYRATHPCDDMSNALMAQAD